MPVAPPETEPLRLFVRQPLTRSSPDHRDVVQAVVDLATDPRVAGGPVTLLPYPAAQHAGTFKEAFTEETGLPFTPAAFRAWRLGLLDSAQAMLVVRTELSESGAYEVAYNVHAGPRLPVFFAVHDSCPIRTTLLQDLAQLVDARYHSFEQAWELAGPLQSFLAAARLRAVRRTRRAA
jgi:carbamoyl-phosphate synthase large subunit